MSHDTIDRLKELLFEEESRDIGAANRRLDALSARLDGLADRVGTDETMRRSVARVIDRSIADAETSRHAEMTVAMAPMVVRTINTELASPQTQDQLTGLLYPRIGEMVSRFVSDAMRDLMDRINRTLESGLMNNRLMLRLRSIFTGRSMAELALASTQRLEIEELFLIRRGSGELIDRWSVANGEQLAASGGNRDTLVSGFLTALTSFAEEAFEADKASLRALDLGEHRIYLRGSPSHLLALKCKGSATQSVEVMLDECLLRLLKAIPPDGHAQDGVAPLPEMAADLTKRVETRETEIRRQRSMRPLKLVFWFLILPLLLLIGWQSYIAYTTRQLQAAVDKAIRDTAELQGFPIQARVEHGGKAVWVGGLAPDDASRDVLLARIRMLSPQAEVAPTIGVLPRTDVAGAVATANFERSVERAGRYLKALEPELAALAASTGDPALKVSLQSARDALGRGMATLSAPARPREQIEAALRELVASLGSLADELATPAATVTGGGEVGTVSAERGASAAEQLIVVSERVKLLSAIQRQQIAAQGDRERIVLELQRQLADRDRTLAGLESRQAALGRELDGLRNKPTPMQELEAFVRRNALFFSANTDYRDGAAAVAMLDELAAKIVAADGFLRIVGYTDDVGAPQRNQALSLQRADKVADELAQRGVARNRMVAVGRGISFITPKAGGMSNSNRRVEFEVGFKGEGTDAQ